MDDGLPPFVPPGAAPTAASGSALLWPNFPPTYRDLVAFQMPATAADTSTTNTTAPWSGAHPPPIPLCYSYLDPSIPVRALAGLECYLSNHRLWARPTPNDARALWRQLQDSYQGLPITQESWLTSVLTILNLIVAALLKDLGLAHALLSYDPHLLFSQHGDKDWLATSSPVGNTVQALIEVMETAGGPNRLPIGAPIVPPLIGGGCSVELKLSNVLLEYSHYFSEPFHTFQPLSAYTQGSAIVFKLDLQMQNRVIARRVSSYAPRFGIIYTGQYFLLAENVHPLTILAPYWSETPQGKPFPRGPPLTSPFDRDVRIRGLGLSQIEHIAGDDVPPFPGFLALLVAINARPGMLEFDDPNSDSMLPGLSSYLSLYGSLQSATHQGQQSTRTSPRNTRLEPGAAFPISRQNHSAIMRFGLQITHLVVLFLSMALSHLVPTNLWPLSGTEGLRSRHIVRARYPYYSLDS
ncbi:hypothetical protein R3P38DRAFT_2934090 [Favolaschia claudopus]|uniref:Uncharacterized protein n=1 Tax=Favolaschia claudopus TaxID=2862362 RepID=A0AAW0BRC3_9AGAR